jgi:hypothetical protein
MTALSPGRPEDQHNGAGRLDVPSDASSSPGPPGQEPGNSAARDDTGQLPDGTGDDDWVPL